MRKSLSWAYHMQTNLLFIILFALNTTTFSQAPAIQWQKNYGGSNFDYAYSTLQTTDGGFIIAGGTNSADGDITANNGLNDCWIIKISNTGSIEWQKTYGGTNDENAFCIRQTTDGGYIFTGTTLSINGDITNNHGMSDSWVVKLNAAGSIQWQKTYGGSSFEQAFSIEQTTDGGFIVGGSTQSVDGDITSNHGNSDYWIVKLSSIGEIEWQKTHGGSNADEGIVIVQQTADGGYIMGGQSRSTNGEVTGNHAGSEDFWIVKMNSVGDIEWQRSLGGDGVENLYKISQTSDGGYIIAGSTFSNNGDVTNNQGFNDYWIIKLNSIGNIEWQKSYGGSDADAATDIQQTPDGGYIVVGYSASNDGDITGIHNYDGVNPDYWVVKLNAAGVIQWQKALGGSLDDRAYSIMKTLDGGYIITGYAQSDDGDMTGNYGIMDAWIVKLLSGPAPQFQWHLHDLPENDCLPVIKLHFNSLGQLSSDSIIIEHSTDSLTFAVIGKIAVSNPAQITSYEFTHQNPLFGKNYYRLKINTPSGSWYSQIYKVDLVHIKNIIIYPVPAFDKLFFKQALPEGSRVFVFDMKGSLVIKKRFLSTTREFSLPYLASGQYIMKVYAFCHEKVFKFIKMP